MKKYRHLGVVKDSGASNANALPAYADWELRPLGKIQSAHCIRLAMHEFEYFSRAGQDYGVEVIPRHFIRADAVQIPWIDGASMTTRVGDPNTLDNIANITLTIADYLHVASKTETTERPNILRNLAKLSSYVVDASQYIWMVNVEPTLVPNNPITRDKLAAKTKKLAQRLLLSHDPNHEMALGKISQF